jgi:hypothetical protein
MIAMQAPGADELQALVQRLAIADLDSALELSRLLAATQQAGVIAERLVKSGHTAVALAWLRRITHGVDTLQAEWVKSQASRAQLVPDGTARMVSRSSDRRASQELT